MPSTISAGTTAGTAIAVAGDTTGNLAFQTNGTTTAMTIDTSQNVGIGTTSPARNLSITSSGNTTLQVTNSTSGTASSDGFIVQQNGLNTFLLNQEAGILYLGTSNTERAAITSGGDFQFNSGYGSVATAYGCRAWCNFNGSNGSVRASGNVSSVSRDSTGQYTINFTTAMPNLNYGVSMGGSITFSGGVFYGYGLNDYSSWSTSACKVRFVAGNGTYFDPELACISVFR